MLPPVAPQKQYWNAALATLSPTLQSVILQKAGENIDIIETVLLEAHQKRKVCLEKRWRYKNAKGEVVILRDVMEKIIRWVDKFKTIGDIAVGFDQTQASLPWAAIRFLLVMASSEAKAFGIILETVELATQIIAKYREFERIYLKKTSAVVSQLEAALVRLYAVILEALGNVVQALTESTVHRLVKSPFRLADDYILQIKERDTEVLKLAGLIDSEVINDLRAMNLRLVDSANSYDTNILQAQHQKVLAWMSTINSHVHHSNISNKRIPGTANWLFEHSEFRSWSHSSSSGILLVRGTAGSGKTMLSSRLVDELLSQRRNHQSAAPFAYFYCSASALEPERAQPENIMRHILRQVAMSNGPDPIIRKHIVDEYKRREELAALEGVPDSQIERLGLDDCGRLIIGVTNSDPITIIIDAIDEVSDDQRYKLVHSLDQLVKDSANVVKIFITSRDDCQVQGLLDAYPKIRISVDDNRADVRLFVTVQIEKAVRERYLLNGAVTPDLRAELENFLLSGAGEMFLWAKLQLESIVRTKHRQDILSTIKERKHVTLDELYTGIIHNIFDSGAEARALAIRTFTWLMYAREPLSPESFLVALNQGSTNGTLTLDDVESICYNLLVHDGGQVRFVHQSAQEFIRHLEHFTPEKGNQTLAEVCLRSCINGEPDPMDHDALEFHRYCSMYWAEHYDFCRTSEHIDDLEYLIEEFVFEPGSNVSDPSFSFIAWHDSIRPIAESLPWDHPNYQDLDKITNPDASPFYMACSYGMLFLVKRIITVPNGFNLDRLNDSNQTGLYLASLSGRLEVVRFLLDHGADPYIRCGAQGNALNAACVFGRKHVVELLLSHKDAKWSSEAFAEALNLSFKNLHEETTLEIVRHEILKSSDWDYTGAMLGASQAGFISVVEVLEQSRSQNSNKDRMEENYRKAIQCGRIPMLRFMLKRSLNNLADLPGDGVALASQYGQTDTVAFLLDLGLNIEQPGQFGRPLRTASLMNHPTTMLKLLEHGAEVNARTSLGTALHAAAVKGHVHAVRILVDHGASVDQDDLQGAVTGRHLEVIQIIVSVGTNLRPVTFRTGQWRRWCEISPFLESKDLVDWKESGSRRGYN